MQALRQIWFIALKDLKLFATDRGALFFFVLFPFLFVVLFQFVMSGVGSQDSRLELHLVTREADGISHQIIAAMETKDEALLKPGQPIIIWDKSYDEALKAVEDKKLYGFLAFPEDFTQSLFIGYGTNLEVVVDPEAINKPAALEGLAQSIASRLGAQRVATDAATGLLIEEAMTSGNMADIAQDIQKIFSGMGSMPQAESLITYDIEQVGEVQAENPTNYVIPGYLVMFVFFGAALGAETIVRERQNGTLERLLARSVRHESILGGIFAGTAFKGLVQILIFWVVGILAFRIDMGLAPAAVIILSILMVLMSSAFSVMLATLAKTQRAAGSIAVVVSLALAPLGGCWWPLFVTPGWMQNLSKITPHGWANAGFNKLMVFGADFTAAVPEMLALLGFAVVFAIIAIRRFRTSSV